MPHAEPSSPAPHQQQLLYCLLLARKTCCHPQPMSGHKPGTAAAQAGVKLLCCGTRELGASTSIPAEDGAIASHAGC